MRLLVWGFAPSPTPEQGPRGLGRLRRRFRGPTLGPVLLLAVAGCSRAKPAPPQPAAPVILGAKLEADAGPDRAAALHALNQGRAKAKAKDWEGALTELDRALAITPDDPHVLSEIGWAAFQANDLARAEEANGHALAGTNEPRVRAPILYNMGRVAEARGNKTVARKAYRDSLALRDNADVKRHLAGLAAPAEVEETKDACKESFADIPALCRCLNDHEAEVLDLAPAEKKSCRLEGSKPLGDGRLSALRFGGEEIGETIHFLIARENGRIRIVADLGHDFEPGAFGVHNSASVSGGTRKTVAGHTVVVVSSVQNDNDFNMAGLELCRYEAKLETVCAVSDEKTTCSPPLPVHVDGGCDIGVELDPKDIDADTRATIDEIKRNATHYEVTASWSLSDGGVETFMLSAGMRDRIAAEALAPHTLWRSEGE